VLELRQQHRLRLIHRRITLCEKARSGGPSSF